MIPKNIIPHSRPWIIDEDIKEVNKTLSTGFIANGAKVRLFEKNVCKHLNTSFGIALASGTAALTLALKLLGLKKNDEVIIPTYVCDSVLHSVLSIKATPILCDVNINGVITFENVCKKITQKTKAIIAVHIFGHTCDVEALQSFKIPVISDLCQSFGFEKNCNGTILGDVGILSFHATKCLTTGEGGMLVTNNKALEKKVNKETFIGAQRFKETFPLSDFQASLGISQLRRYSDFLDKRLALKKQFDKEATRVGLKLRNTDKDFLFRYTLFCDQNFIDLKKEFFENGIILGKGVDALLHRKLKMNDDGFPVASTLFERTLSIPFYPSLNEQETNTIINSLSLAL